jgi:hypothetical protein
MRKRVTLLGASLLCVQQGLTILIHLLKYQTGQLTEEVRVLMGQDNYIAAYSAPPTGAHMGAALAAITKIRNSIIFRLYSSYMPSIANE